jgi:hypothetical protein
LDWTAAIDKHREALTRILAALVAMAGFPVLQACGGAALAGGGDTLPRHLHRALLALLRPAEAAARRLVIIAARRLVVELAAARHKPRNGISLPPGGGIRAKPPRPGFRLFDPLPRWNRRVPQAAVPRISVPGFTAPFVIAARRAPSPHDPIDAARLAQRLEALGSVLEDLPRHAKRFARWRAAKAGAQQGGRPARFRRIWPLRPGRPPGPRSRRSRRPADAVHTVLDDLHGLAVWALNDTS